MSIAEQQQLVILEEFQRRAQARTREQRAGLEQERQFDRQKREARREEKQREYLETLAAIERASEAQIASFCERLTHYDTAIVEALMENEQALDDTSGKLDGMRAQACALPDGRKVFKTTDGQQVFDEHGVPVARDTLDPDAIGEGRPCWESFKTQLDARTQLEQERRALLDFQARADKAREKAGEEGISGKNSMRSGPSWNKRCRRRCVRSWRRDIMQPQAPQYRLPVHSRQCPQHRRIVREKPKISHPRDRRNACRSQFPACQTASPCPSMAAPLVLRWLDVKPEQRQLLG
jgi:hypothetical protein